MDLHLDHSHDDNLTHLLESLNTDKDKLPYSNLDSLYKIFESSKTCKRLH